MILKSIRKLFFWSFLFVFIAVLLNYQWVSFSQRKFAYVYAQDIEANNVGIILGTSPYLSDGSPNRSFQARIDAAARLYQANKVNKLLVSGSNDGQYYDEGQLMTAALVAKGVPQDAIVSDNAGYRTLDSIVRAKKVFKLNQFTIISQPYHNYRALYLAHHFGINAVAYNAETIGGWENVRAQFREHGARVLMMLDIYFLDTQPKSLAR